MHTGGMRRTVFGATAFWELCGMIKPKIGDILDEPPGAIFAEAGTLVTFGVVIIHRSRLRRAERYGWNVTEIAGLPVDPPLIAVARA